MRTKIVLLLFALVYPYSTWAYNLLVDNTPEVTVNYNSSNPVQVSIAWTDIFRYALTDKQRSSFDDWYWADCIVSDDETYNVAADDERYVTPKACMMDNAYYPGYQLKIFNLGSDIWGNDAIDPITGGNHDDKIDNGRTKGGFEKKSLGEMYYYPRGGDSSDRVIKWELSVEEIEALMPDKNYSGPVKITRWFRFVAKDQVSSRAENSVGDAPYPYVWVKFTLQITRTTNYATLRYESVTPDPTEGNVTNVPAIIALKYADNQSVSIVEDDEHEVVVYQDDVYNFTPVALAVEGHNVVLMLDGEMTAEGDWYVVIPEGTITNGFSPESPYYRCNPKTTLIYTVENELSLYRAEATALLAAGGKDAALIGYPADGTASRQALIDVVAKGSKAIMEELQKAINDYYAETNVKLPEDCKWYKLAAVNERGEKQYLKYEKYLSLTTKASEASAFKAFVNSESQTYSFKTSDDKFLNVQTISEEQSGTLAMNLSAGGMSSLTLAKFSVEGQKLTGFLTLKCMDYAVVAFGDETLLKTTGSTVQYGAGLTSAFSFVETAEETKPEEDPTSFVEDFYEYNAYQSLSRSEPYIKDTDLNELYIFSYGDGVRGGIAADANKRVSVVRAYSDSEIAWGHFEPYPEFAEENGYAPGTVQAVKLVMDVPIEAGSLDYASGLFGYLIPAGTLGDLNFGRYLAGDPTVKPGDCHVNKLDNSITFNVNNEQANKVYPSSETIEYGRKLLKMTGLGYPDAYSSARMNLQYKMNHVEGSDELYQGYFNDFYNETNVVKPSAGKYYKVYAVAADGTKAYLDYDGSTVGVTADPAKATGFKMAVNEDGTYRFVTGNDTYLRQLSNETNTSAAYAATENDITVAKLSINGVDPVKTFGLFSLKMENTYALVDVKNAKILTATAALADSDNEKTNAFMFEEVSVANIPIPTVKVELSPATGSEVEQLEQVQVFFSGVGHVELADKSRITLTNLSGESMNPVKVETSANDPNKFLIDFVSVAPGQTYFLSIGKGAFTYTFAELTREVEHVTAVYTVQYNYVSQTYSLAIKSTGNGSVTYNGTSIRSASRTFTVKASSDVKIFFSPDNGHRIKSVRVNNTDVTASVSNDSYTISDISKDTNVEVEFEAIPSTTYTLSITATGNGSASYDGTTIRGRTSTFTLNEGTNATITFTPDNGYRIRTVKVNNSAVSVSNNQYTVSNISRNTTVEVEFEEGVNAFTVNNVNYSVNSSSDRTVIVAKGNYGNLTVWTIPAKVTYKDTEWTVSGIEDGTLANSTDLCAIIWNPEAAFTESVSNPNLLLYVKAASYAPNTIKNVVINGTAETITLKDATSGNNFYCPQEFTAKSISYTHHFTMETGLNESKGWETIALPFDVQKVEHQSKGGVEPFANWKSGDSKKPFWLKQYGNSGWRDANSIKAYTPYIISMPNHTKYKEEYKLVGNVTFSAENVKIRKTEEENLTTSYYNGKTFVPNFNYNKDRSLYALNVINDYASDQGGQIEGSLFTLGLRDIHPFEAYMKNASGTRSIVIADDMTTTGIYDVIEMLDEQNGIRVYDLKGQLIKIEEGKTMNEVKKALPAGIYIVNGQKLIIK